MKGGTMRKQLSRGVCRLSSVSPLLHLRTPRTSAKWC
jgi:hypothetical protein